MFARYRQNELFLMSYWQSATRLCRYSPSQQLAVGLKRAVVHHERRNQSSQALLLRQGRPYRTISVIVLEFLSPLKSGFPMALHLQSTVELVLQYLSHGVLHHHFNNESRYEDLPCDGCFKLVPLQIGDEEPWKKQILTRKRILIQLQKLLQMKHPEFFKSVELHLTLMLGPRPRIWGLF